MGDAPQDFKVVEVFGDNKVALEGYDQAVDVSPAKGGSLPPFSAGQELRGWFNQGKFGPYLKLAGERQSNGGGIQVSNTVVRGRSDTTGRSIERQVAAKIAGDIIGHEGYSQMEDGVFAQEFRKVTDAVHAAIVGTDESLPF